MKVLPLYTSSNSWKDSCMQLSIREQILVAARVILQEHPTPVLTRPKLAEAAGVGADMVSLHFRDRTSLLEALRLDHERKLS